jgi:diacylglycerol kinase (ATP)
MRAVAAEFRRLRKACGWSCDGIKATFTSQAAFRFEVAVAVIFTPVAFLLGRTPVERLLLVAALIAVLVVELINTAVEAVVDRVGLDYHDLSKLAKDAGSAAVLLTTLYGFSVWGYILYDRLSSA